MKTELTPRESMLWAMAASGASDKQIASELGLSRQRVSGILVSLRRKLGIEPQGARMLVAVWYQRREANRARMFHRVLRTPRP
jgi:DNA-binding NarL/FixJ family response regulator